jgi:hypothetical protein
LLWAAPKQQTYDQADDEPFAGSQSVLLQRVFGLVGTRQLYLSAYIAQPQQRALLRLT